MLTGIGSGAEHPVDRFKNLFADGMFFIEEVMPLPFASDDGCTGKNAANRAQPMFPVDHGIMGSLKYGDRSLKLGSTLELFLPLDEGLAPLDGKNPWSERVLPHEFEVICVARALSKDSWNQAPSHRLGQPHPCNACVPCGVAKERGDQYHFVERIRKSAEHPIDPCGTSCTVRDQVERGFIVAVN